MKKRYLLIAMCLLLALSPIAALAETMYINTSNGGSVNMRSGPSTDYDVMTSVPYGAAVQVIEWLLGGSFVNVSYDGYYGYVMARYLSNYPPSPEPTYWPTYVPAPTARPTSKPTARPNNNTSNTLEKTLSELFAGFTTASYSVVVVPSTPTTYVNLRWAPSKSAPVRTQYWAGTTLQVLSHNGTWSEVYDASTGMHGYMMSSFLTTNGVGAVGSDS